MPADITPIVFRCADHDCVGMLHEPAAPSTRGVLIVVGGPQYRAGSHRQFVHLAHDLAAAGFVALRFDYRGMGDSDGAARTFEDIGTDIRAAVDELTDRHGEIEEVILWGLCDAATAAAFYAAADARVTGLILVNPWVRTEQGIARSYLRNYYGRRLLEPDFWKQLLTGRIRVGKMLTSFCADIAAGIGRRSAAPAPGDDSGSGKDQHSGTGAAPNSPLPERMAAAVDAFPGPVLFVMSGQDLTAGEFDAAARSRPWRRALRGRNNISWARMEAADHTFSRRAWRDELATRCIDWLRQR